MPKFFFLALALPLLLGAGCAKEPVSPPTTAINNFSDCVAAGNPIMESYPRQCRTTDGQLFVEELATPPMPPLEDPGAPKPICEDLCGDGTCQEIVCLGTGCPCAETPKSCPADCTQ